MSRMEDVRIEQVCGRFLDENFYSKLGCQFERNSVLSSQYLGVDVTVWSDAGEFVIDEKCKFGDGAVNGAIGCPSFELTRIDGSGGRRVGWYPQEKQLTNVYAFISPFLAEGDKPWQIVDGNLTATQILIVPKKSVRQYVGDHGLSDADLVEKAEILAGTDDSGLDYKKKAYDRVSPGRLWLTYSAGLPERPVNLVITRDELRKLKGVVDLYATKESIKRV